MSRFSVTILILSTLILIGQIVSIIFLDSDVAVCHIAFQLFENLLMIIVTLVPVILGRTANMKIPKAMEIAFVGFCFASLVMGDLLDFYGRFPWWDVVLHGISGIMLGILGYAIFNFFNANAPRPPLFMAIWIICFAMGSGAMWEIFEYITDGIFGLNSQQFLTSSGTFDHTTPLQGRAALQDTMEDLILDFLGSTVIAIIAYCGLQNQPSPVHKTSLFVDGVPLKPSFVQETNLFMDRRATGGTKNSREKVPGVILKFEQAFPISMRSGKSSGRSSQCLSRRGTRT